jgi:hypothetical protein
MVHLGVAASFMNSEIKETQITCASNIVFPVKALYRIIKWAATRQSHKSTSFFVRSKIFRNLPS